MWHAVRHITFLSIDTWGIVRSLQTFELLIAPTLQSITPHIRELTVQYEVLDAAHLHQLIELLIALEILRLADNVQWLCTLSPALGVAVCSMFTAPHA